ncbi:hypothetical protein FOL47_011381 [Perkinsus chesapeaki]|uniref:Uncharacterized protein n=1 Tax=Perkinsus chesapeaki TaxID=330153 RepID=A0A7J6KX10_PERCH|nr:hypothetical protein FOL47_011381 [Perkinsus chesapeaki]
MRCIQTDITKPGRFGADRPSPLRSMGSSNSAWFGLACRASDESDRPASNVTDASQKTFWRTAQSRAWIELDLSGNDFENRPVQVTQIIIFWYGNCHSDNFKIQTSTGEMGFGIKNLFVVVDQSWHTAIEGTEAKHCSAAEGYKFHPDVDGNGKRWTGSTFNRISKLPRLDGLCSKIRLEMGDGHPDIWFGRYKFGIRRLVIRGFYRKDTRQLNLSLDSFLAKQRKSGLSLRHSFHGGDEEHQLRTPEDEGEPAWLVSSKRKRRSGGGKRVHPPAMIRSNGFPTVSMFMNKAADVGSNKAWLATGSPLLKIANRRRIDEAKQGIRPCSTQADRRLREEAASREAGIKPNSGAAANREPTTDEHGSHSRTATASTQEGAKSDPRRTATDRQVRPGRRTFLPMLPTTLYDNFVCRVGSRSYTPPHHKRRLTAHEKWFYENGHLGGRRKSLEGIGRKGMTQARAAGKARLGADRMQILPTGRRDPKDLKN